MALEITLEEVTGIKNVNKLCKNLEQIILLFKEMDELGLKVEIEVKSIQLSNISPK